MEKYDVVLYNSSKLFGNRYGEHLGLAYIASSLRSAGYKVKILDSLLEGLSPENAVMYLENIDFNILGVSFLSYGWQETKDFLRLIRICKPYIKIVVGGHFVSFTYEKVLKDMPEIDYILLGEGEVSFTSLVKSLINGFDNLNTINGIYSNKVINLNVEPILDLDSLPFPSRDYLPIIMRETGKACLNTSRGCFSNCCFCSVQNFYNRYSNIKWRSRSPQNVIEEIEFLVKDYKVKYFDFQDDNFMGIGDKGKERAQEIAALIKKRKIDCKFSFDLRANDIDIDTLKAWREVGLVEVLIGVESIVEDELKFYKKNLKPDQIKTAISTLRNLGINYRLGMILFNPFSKISNIYTNLRFLKDINYTDTNILTVLNIYEGTYIYTVLKDRKLLKGNYYNYHWDFVDSTAKSFFDICLNYSKKLLVIKRKCNKEDMITYLDQINQDFMMNLSQRFINNCSITDLMKEYDEELVKIYNSLF